MEKKRKLIILTVFKGTYSGNSCKLQCQKRFAQFQSKARKCTLELENNKLLLRFYKTCKTCIPIDRENLFAVCICFIVKVLLKFPMMLLRFAFIVSNKIQFF